MRTLGPSAPLECVFLVSVMIVQQLACFPTQPVPRGAWLPSCVLRAVWLGVKSRGSSSIVVSEGPSPDDLVGVSLSDELGALGRVEVKAPRCPESSLGSLFLQSGRPSALCSGQGSSPAAASQDHQTKGGSMRGRQGGSESSRDTSRGVCSWRGGERMTEELSLQTEHPRPRSEVALYTRDLIRSSRPPG